MDALDIACERVEAARKSVNAAFQAIEKLSAAEADAGVARFWQCARELFEAQASLRTVLDSRAGDMRISADEKRSATN